MKNIFSPLKHIAVITGVLTISSSIPLFAHNSEYITTSGNRFVLAKSHRNFVVWGNDGADDLPHLKYLKSIGTNTVRVFVAFHTFMDAPTLPDYPYGKPDAVQEKKLGDLVNDADSLDMRLDITGLADFRPKDVPAWYDAMDEADRWNAHAAFWKAVAETSCKAKGSNAVFCYDLMNEPSAGSSNPKGSWYLADSTGIAFDQFLTRTRNGRSNDEIVDQWLVKMTAAIHSVDRRHLITVGELPGGGYFGGLLPSVVAHDLDFLSPHEYPGTGKVSDALADLNRFAVGKPIVVEETMTLACGADDESRFLERSDIAHGGVASGWIGHYAGVTIEQYRERHVMQKIQAGTLYQIWLILSKDPQDLGFEIPSFDPKGDLQHYGPKGTPWVFTAQSGNNGSGTAENGSELTAGNADVPEGRQVAFIQGTGSISQDFYFANGVDYVIAFKAAQHKNAAQKPQAIAMQLDKVGIGKAIVPTTVNYRTYRSVPFNIGVRPSGFYNIAFAGENQSGSSALIDCATVTARR